MKVYIAELRNNGFAYDRNSEPVGFLGICGYRGDTACVGCVQDRASAFEFAKESQFNYELKKLSDEFFDRFAVDIVAIDYPEC